MSFGTAVRTVLGKYATFSGRARRSEFWWFYLAYTLAVGVLYVIGLALVVAGTPSSGAADESLTPVGVAGAVVLGAMGLLSLALVVPTLAVMVRRLHDTGRSGWWYLISFVPFGGIVLLVFAAMDSAPGTNQWGPNPKGTGDAYGGGYGGAGYGAPGYGAAGYGTPGSPAPQPYGPA